MNYQEIAAQLGEEAQSLLEHRAEKIPASSLTTPGPNQVQEIFAKSDRPDQVLESLRQLYAHGRLAGTGYLSIFPVDQGLEHTAGYSFAENSQYFDPENIVKFAIEGGCSAVTSSAGALGLVSDQYARTIPFIVKLNHSEHLTYPAKTNQILFATVNKAWNMGALGVGATVYFGSEESHRQIEEISLAFEAAHSLGMFTVLWCYPRNPHYLKDNHDYSSAVDITAQACYLGASMGADIIKQKMPEPLYGFQQLGFGKYNEQMYSNLIGAHPIDLVRYQVLHCYGGKIGLINSGGEAVGGDDLRAAIRTAVINKRAGGTGLMIGRKLFKRPWNEGLAILRAVQDVYLEPQITIA